MVSCFSHPPPLPRLTPALFEVSVGISLVSAEVSSLRASVPQTPLQHKTLFTIFVFTIIMVTYDICGLAPILWYTVIINC